jgi:hypothetical protein
MDRIELETVVGACTSYRQVGKRLGVNNQTAKKTIEEHGLDTSHFDFGRRSFNYVGRLFNRLTVREVFKRTDGRWFCRCDCECGTKDVMRRLDGVISGHVPSCGCAYRNRPAMVGSNNPAYAGCGEILGSRMYWIKRGAERRGLPFEVTKEYLWELFLKQNRKCALSGTELQFGRMYFQLETNASLDRIDSAKGYVAGNLQWVHKDVNKIKRDLDQDYFLAWCRRISDHSRIVAAPGLVIDRHGNPGEM